MASTHAEDLSLWQEAQREATLFLDARYIKQDARSRMAAPTDYIYSHWFEDAHIVAQAVRGSGFGVVRLVMRAPRDLNPSSSSAKAPLMRSPSGPSVTPLLVLVSFIAMKLERSQSFVFDAFAERYSADEIGTLTCEPLDTLDEACA